MMTTIGLRTSGWITALALLGAACSQDIPPPPVRNLDRPSAVTFACFGDLRLTEDDRIVTGAQPVSSCQAHGSGNPPPGQEDLVTPQLFGFVLQPSRGTVAVVSVDVNTVIDSDPLTPGKNAIPVGTLPVGIVTDRSSCHIVTANAGSCDLTRLAVSSALDFRSGKAATIRRGPIRTASGELLRAKPRTMVAEPPEGVIGVECPDDPTGVFYVAYPACNLVAAVDAGTGDVVAGIRFEEDGSVVITDGDVSCPVECGGGAIGQAQTDHEDAGPADAGPPDAGPPDAGDMMPPPPPVGGTPRPGTLHMMPDGSRLYIAAENSPVVTVVDLDEDRLPSALTTVRLEGEVGLTRLDVTDVIEMGGELGTLTGPVGEFSFLYAVATDATVRVVDADRLHECDTQVDPRYLLDERDVEFLSCMPVGDPRTPPRRARARSPGIEIPGNAIPLDLAFAPVRVADDPGSPDPIAMAGYFAFVTATNGFVYVINVDDDNYADFEDPNDPTRVYLPLALPHQVRDFGRLRDEVAQSCSLPTSDRLQFGPRLGNVPQQLVNPAQVALEQFHVLPSFRSVTCTAGDNDQPVPELAFAAPAPVRKETFPDLRAAQNEDWSLTWEGALSVDGPGSAVSGPPVRQGLLEAGGGEVAIVDALAPFCRMGVEPFDMAVVVGCDPARGSADCGVGESCFVHPDSPTVVRNGMCIPAGQVDVLSGACRNFLISRRRYTVKETHAGRIVLGERRRVLRTTPLDGCESATQCQVMYEEERYLADPSHPAQRSPLEGPMPQFVCAPDPTRAPGPDVCQMRCDSSADCEEGFACSANFCVEGPLPPAQCLQSVQRYQVRAGGVFAVVGNRSGFLHRRVVDPASGECVEDPLAHPLQVGRIPLRPPPCEGDGPTDLSPNPCSLTIDHVEEFIPHAFNPETNACTPQPLDVRLREAPAVRFRNPAMTFHLIDTESSGDASCRADGLGSLPPHGTVFTGYQLGIELTGGFFPMFVTPIEAAFPFTAVRSPDGRIWVMDQGDASSVTRGRIFTLDPRLARDGFAVVTIL